MNRLEFAVEQIQLARSYTLRLLDDIDPDVWFQIPSAGVSHVAWQVGHLAMAEYRLSLERIRGARSSDEEFFPKEFAASFAKDSVPISDSSPYPTAVEIRSVFDGVHKRTIEELVSLAEEQLDEPPMKPHPLFDTKFGSLTWTSRHEMLHAGQIGLLRRQLGAPPIW
jgi:uncharacterized damage-inducible protein DinB